MRADDLPTPDYPRGYYVAGVAIEDAWTEAGVRLAIAPLQAENEMLRTALRVASDQANEFMAKKVAAEAELSAAKELLLAEIKRLQAKLSGRSNSVSAAKLAQNKAEKAAAEAGLSAAKELLRQYVHVGTIDPPNPSVMWNGGWLQGIPRAVAPDGKIPTIKLYAFLQERP